MNMISDKVAESSVSRLDTNQENGDERCIILSVRSLSTMFMCQILQTRHQDDSGRPSGQGRLSVRQKDTT